MKGTIVKKNIQIIDQKKNTKRMKTAFEEVDAKQKGESTINE